MAKLHARGRTEVVRLTRTGPTNTKPGQLHTSLALMSDGVILSKATAKYEDGSKLDWGWRQHGKLKSGATPEQWIEAKVKTGWERI